MCQHAHVVFPTIFGRMRLIICRFVYGFSSLCRAAVIPSKITTVIADKKPFRQLVKNITDYLEKEQVDQVLDAAHQCSMRDYLMLRVLWRTGVRVNELLTITPRDIEPNNSVVNVTKAKGGKQRRVHLDAATIKMLSDYVSAQQLPDDRPIFALKQRQVRNIAKRYGSVIGKDVHPHTFRHSYAIHCVRNGWDIRRLQQVLGHSSLNVTAVYLQFNDQDIKALYDKTPF
jgi:integrase/recombinase XerD